MYIQIEVPEINEYLNGFPTYWFKRSFVGSLSFNAQVNALATTYVRLVEVALLEYGLGRIALKEYWENEKSSSMASIHRAISHFENCISSVHRAVKCFRRLRKFTDELNHVLSVKSIGFVSDKNFGLIVKIRDEIQHLDEHIIKNLIAEKESFTLKPDGPEVKHPTEIGQTIKTIDRLTIGKNVLMLSSLATWLKEMGSFAEKLAAHDRIA